MSSDLEGTDVSEDFKEQSSGFELLCKLCGVERDFFKACSLNIFRFTKTCMGVAMIWLYVILSVHEDLQEC